MKAPTKAIPLKAGRPPHVRIATLLGSGLLAAATLLAGSVAYGQESPNKGPATGDHAANSTTPKTYEGCVIRSNGKIMLTDARNKDYVLVSSARSLDSYVGQEVQLSAVNMNPSDPSSDERGISAEEPQNQPMTLDVENIQKVSERCSSPQSTDKKK
jgi:hypothetical protein